MSYFPILIDIAQKNCLVVGGGKVALRKVRALLDFGGIVTVVSPELTEGLGEIDGIRIIREPFDGDIVDIEDFFLVVAASANRELNKTVGEMCRAHRILVNVVDAPDECTYIVPSYIKKKNVVASFSGGGDSPVIAKYLKEQNKDIVTDRLGDIGELLGACRDLVKRQVKSVEGRKKVYETILTSAIMEDKLLTMEEISELSSRMDAEN